MGVGRNDGSRGALGDPSVAGSGPRLAPGALPIILRSSQIRAGSYSPPNPPKWAPGIDPGGGVPTEIAGADAPADGTAQGLRPGDSKSVFVNPTSPTHVRQGNGGENTAFTTGFLGPACASA